MLFKTMPLRTKATLIAALISAVLIGFSAWQFYQMTATSHLPVWAAILLMLPRLSPLALIWLIWSVTVRRQEILAQGCAVPVFIIAIFVAQSLGLRTADHYYLVYLYGPERVRTEQLQLVRPPKNNPPWRVFSGLHEIAQPTDYAVWNEINGAVWNLVFFTSLTSVLWILPRRSAA